ncbi:DUF4402 domain-containing protein [Phenylobacterium hankyongense]|nr:DUF4402 domain-containing protein [Phenylobacterium hankyongense]
MTRAPAYIIASVVALAFGAQAFAAARADLPVQATIVESAGIDIVSPLLLPSVTTSVAGQTAGRAGSTSSSSGPGNATLTIHGQSGDAVSMAVPESFRVVRSGGTEALTVNTSTNAGLNDNGVVLGTVMNGDTMSVNVGGAVNLASADRLVPGPYAGLLVVVVQYN